MGKLAGKTALITGASSGLGERFAEILSAEGANVALAARRTDRLEALKSRIEQSGGQDAPRAITVKLDVTDLPGIKAAVADVEAQLGKIDILVNNSGVSAQKKLLDVSEEDYDFTMDTNTKGAFFVAQAVAAGMVKRKIEGRIINIASVAGLRVLSQLSVYCMSKAAVVQMTKAMALEWLRFGINVNAICPGYIRTELNDEHFDSEAGQKLIQQLPRKRLGLPSDLDGVLLLMAADESRFLNGAVVSVDDGHSVL